MKRLLPVLLFATVAGAQPITDPTDHRYGHPVPPEVEAAHREAEMIRAAERAVGHEPYAGEEPEGQGTLLRPLDRATPEDAAEADLVRRIFEAIPCCDLTPMPNGEVECVPAPSGICLEAKMLIESGGEPLARYLGRQIDAGERERRPDGKPWEDQGTLPYIIGRIGPEACGYLNPRAARLKKDKENAAAQHRSLTRAERNAGYWNENARGHAGCTQ